MEGCTGRLKERVRNNDILIFGGIVDTRSGAVIEAFHDAGFDVALIDREHTALNTETILEHIRMCRALGFPCMVRVADDSYHEFGRTLDQAPDGIFVPRVRTREQMEEIVRKVKYPPRGIRGFGGSTCPSSRYMGWPTPQDQIDHSNNDIVLGIQIETDEALQDLDGILSVDGVDIAVVGNDDLTLGMGIVGQLENPRYTDTVMRVIETCHRHGVMPGIAGGDPEWIGFWVERGMRAIWCAVDICLLWQAAIDQVRSVRQAAGLADTDGDGAADGRPRHGVAL